MIKGLDVGLIIQDNDRDTAVFIPKTLFDLVKLGLENNDKFNVSYLSFELIGEDSIIIKDDIESVETSISELKQWFE
ncbi:hypothetical protein [Bacteroides sp.]|uniref:hypothetical protein n=1 Tax=Bacteroides sp. TaxID=29523 RepID=UPI00261F96AC|nr:hypothetical protein [Bacteroides sp.]MDD3039627.1 hypothetical protein [Bacteroides sp.]